MSFADVAGYVLAGGESSRMQRADLPPDKALLMLGGATLLERSMAALLTLCSGPRILCGNEERCARFRKFGPTVPDRVMLAGPLGGLDAALNDAAGMGAAWVLITPVDLPWLTSALLGAFLQCVRQSDAAVACMRAEGAVQPLPVILRTDSAPLVAAAIVAGERKVMLVLRAVAERCGTPSGLFVVDADDLVPAEEVAAKQFRNVNTPLDLEAALRDETLRGRLHQSKHGG